MAEKTKITHLQLIDVFVLGLVLFGSAVVSSTSGYFELVQNGAAMPDVAEFTFSDSDNYHSIAVELASLFIAWLYLRRRRFDFKTLNFSVNRRTLPLALLLVVCAGLAADVYQYLHAWVFPHHFDVPETAAAAAQTAGISGHVTLPLVVFSLLNGFYEEVFFLGLVYAVAPQHLRYTLPASLLVRFAFHTYQGLAGAAAITTLGVVYILFRKKTDKLVPFMLAHAFFDVFGLGILHWFPALWG